MYDRNPARFRVFFSFLIIACCLFAESIRAQDMPLVRVMSSPATREEEDDSKVTGATVRGKLVYEDTNRPFRYALISLVAENGKDNVYNAKFVKTDENGEFVIKNVKPGTYTAFVRGDGILNQNSYRFSYRRSADEQKPENQMPKIEIAGMGEFQIVVAARRGGAISGRILYSDGEAAVGVRVEVLRKDGETFANYSPNYSSDAGIGRSVTDDRGMYRINGLPEGQYIVRVVEPAAHNSGSPQYFYNSRENQNSFLRTYYPEGETSKGARPLDLVPGQEQAGIDVTLPERQLYAISGKIKKKNTNEPLDNFTVSIYRMSDRDELVSEPFYGPPTTSNKAGEWSLRSLPKGKYRITILQNNVYNSNRDAGKKQEQYPNLSREIEITDRNLTDVDFEVPTEASVSGTITVEGGKELPREVRIFAVNEENKQLLSSETDSSQNKPAQAPKEIAFRIGKMSGGEYRLTSLSSQNYYVKSVTLGSRDLLSAPFEVKEGEDIKGVQVVISTNMGSVKGKVARLGGKEDAFVALIEANAVFGQMQSKSFTARVTPTGDFEVKAAPGEYTIVVLTPKDRPKSQEEAKEWFENLVKSGQKVTVRENETTNVSLSMPN